MRHTAINRNHLAGYNAKDYQTDLSQNRFQSTSGCLELGSCAELISRLFLYICMYDVPLEPERSEKNA
jgi:hypothetical protein